MPGFEWFGEEERREVADVLGTGVLMRYNFDAPRQGHWKARELEAALRERLGARHAHACSSGTSALAAAMAALGIGAGDEVIVPPFTFVADIEGVLLAGAVPVFADVDETLCLAPAAVEAAITPRTKAVLVVHMCGAMARIDRLADLCRRRDLVLLEDAAQALGATFQGRPLGTFGAAGCYSFDFVKTITCGEGGAVVTADDEVYFRAQAYTDHGHDHRGNDRGAETHPFWGTNHRISELHAAVGLAQLRKLDRILETQRHHQGTLRVAAASVAGVKFRELPDPAGDSATFLDLLLPDAGLARAVAADLPKEGVDGAFYWFGNNWHYHRQWDHFKTGASPAPLWQQKEGLLDGLSTLDLPASDAILSRTVSLQIRLGWTPDQLATRADRLAAVLQRHLS
ncbi:MAG: DegT/DnrJ/EryC1/StrS family aminotransferase [Puniceicoccaceae bacterium]|nr:MAG: DegT/DnrJ/EryC1/StrS family aminotransferase [Puniceicoccaceae bacterium]